MVPVALSNQYRFLESQCYQDLLVSIDNCSQIDLPSTNQRLQLSCNSGGFSLAITIQTPNTRQHLLRGISRINNNRLLRRFIRYKVGIIIALPRPWQA